MDLDLMRQELALLKIKKNEVGLAVIDSGLDAEVAFKYFATHDIAYSSGNISEVGDPRRDDDGHGTSVAGVVADKNFGSGPDLRIEIIRDETPLGKYLPEIIDIKGILTQMEYACDHGYEIINFSAGSNTDYGKTRFEKAWSQALEKLTQKGCMVFIAAGNDDYRKKYRSNKLDDNLVRVEALDSMKGPSLFADRGEIAAPGTNVFSLESHQKIDDYGKPIDKENDPDFSKNHCQGVDGSFLNGSSLSSPLDAGVAGEVRTLLKSCANYNALNGPDKIKLTDRILKASEWADSTNGLRSVVIAKAWCDTRSKDIPSVIGLRDLLQGSNSVRQTCGEVDQCSNLNFTASDPCWFILRKKLSLCETFSDSEAIRLLNVAEKERDYELAVHLLGILKKIRPGILKSDGINSNAYRKEFGHELKAADKVKDHDIARDIDYFYARAKLTGDRDAELEGSLIQIALDKVTENQNAEQSQEILSRLTINKSLSTGIIEKTLEKGGRNPKFLTALDKTIFDQNHLDQIPPWGFQVLQDILKAPALTRKHISDLVTDIMNTKRLSSDQKMDLMKEIAEGPFASQDILSQMAAEVTIQSRRDRRAVRNDKAVKLLTTIVNSPSATDMQVISDALHAIEHIGSSTDQAHLMEIIVSKSELKNSYGMVTFEIGETHREIPGVNKILLAIATSPSSDDFTLASVLDAMKEYGSRFEISNNATKQILKAVTQSPNCKDSCKKELTQS